MKLLLKNLLFTILVPGTVAVWLPLALFRNEMSWEKTSFWLAVPVVALGATTYAWTVMNFAVIGRATPAPIDAPRRLIVEGPHRYVRNPMYLGVLCVILGWAIAFRSGWLLLYMAIVGAGFHLFVRFVEEPSLRRRFGGQYLDYCKSVRRWLPGRPFSSLSMSRGSGDLPRP